MTRASSARTLSILVGTLYYPPHVRGGYELATAFAVERLRAHGHDVHVVCGRGDGFDDPRVHAVLEPELQDDRGLFDASHEGSNRDRWRLHVNRPANGRATREVLRAIDADLYLAFNQGLVSAAPLLAARRLGVPTLIYACDLWPTNHWIRDWRQRGGKPVRRLALEFLWRRTLGAGGVGPVLANSEFLASELARGGVPRDSIEVAHLSCPPDAFERAASVEVREREPDTPLRVLCASMWWQGKGVHVALDAVARARATGVDVALELVGTGEGAYAERVRRRAAEADLRGCVTLLEGLERPRVLERFAAADVAIVPSSWGEPFALVPLEAAAFGCAIVATRDGGTPEFVLDGRTGLLVEPEDVGGAALALQRLAENEGLRRELASNARDRVRAEHPPERFVERIEARALELARSARP